MITRIPLDSAMSLSQIVMTLAEDNNHALAILNGMVQESYKGIVCLMHLDDMNIRGSQLVAAFILCRNDINRLIDSVFDHSEEFAKSINKAMGEDYPHTCIDNNYWSRFAGMRAGSA